MYYRINGKIVESYCGPNTTLLFWENKLPPQSNKKVFQVPNPWLYSPGFSNVGVL
jgi:hypothetical protein